MKNVICNETDHDSKTFAINLVFEREIIAFIYLFVFICSIPSHKWEDLQSRLYFVYIYDVECTGLARKTDTETS